MTLLKMVSTLIGAVLALGGLIGFCVGLWLVVSYLLFQPTTLHMAGAPQASRPDLGMALICSVGGIIALSISTQLGRFARGDFD